MAEYTPVWGGQRQTSNQVRLSCLTGGRRVEQTAAGSCANAAAGSTKVIGVAAHDAVINAKVTVWPIENAVHEIDSAWAIAVGDGIPAGANGTIATGLVGTLAAAGSLLGIADTAAAVMTRFTGRQ